MARHSRPVLWPSSREGVDFGDSDEAREIIVDGLNEMPDTKDIDVLQCPNIFRMSMGGSYRLL